MGIFVIHDNRIKPEAPEHQEYGNRKDYPDKNCAFAAAYIPL
ncbi:MAG TPA: hypothetical protein PLI90_03520 [Rhodocyclaceae bacterium]|nr:hypothetical protein [Rhodocyclaceae bacterium]